MKHSKKLWLAFFLIFFAGLFLGAAVATFFTVKHQPRLLFSKFRGRGKDYMLNNIATSLELNKIQKQKTKRILDNMLKDIRIKHKQTQGEIRRIIQLNFNKIEKFLESSQKKKLKNLKQRFMRQQKRRKCPGKKQMHSGK
jgi:hypothetical protein